VRRGQRAREDIEAERAERQRAAADDALRMSLALAAERRATAREADDADYERTRRLGRARSAARYLAQYPDLEGLDDDEIIFQGRSRQGWERSLANSKELAAFRSKLPARPQPGGSPMRRTEPAPPARAEIERAMEPIVARMRREAMAQDTAGTLQERVARVAAQTDSIQAAARREAVEQLTRQRAADSVTAAGARNPTEGTTPTGAKPPEQWVAEVRADSAWMRQHPNATPKQVAAEARRRAHATR
jgi:hypothetical protein